MGYTQAAAAELVGTSQRSVAHWETGKGFPEFQTFLAYLAALQIPADWLLDDARTEDIRAAREFAGLVRDLGADEVRRRCLGVVGSPQVGRELGSYPLNLDPRPASDSEPVNDDPPSKTKAGGPARGR